MFAHGMNRRTFLKSAAAIPPIFLPALGWATPQSKIERDNRELEEGANARIQKHRRSALRITAKDSDGKPIPGAVVCVEQKAHQFLFGCNFFMFDKCGDTEAEQRYRSRFAALMNYATLGFYWRMYEPEQGKPIYDYTDRVLEWTSRNGLACKGHPLVWDHPASSPRWLPQDPEQLDRLSKARVRDIITRFKDRIHIWDVVNEAVHLPDKANDTTMAKWAAGVGSVPYVEQHLRVARNSDSKATLIVNDYRIDPPYEKMLRTLLEQDRHLFDVVGIQSHMHDGMWPVNKTWQTCERYAALGLPLHFTETTLVSGPRNGPGENWGETTAKLEEMQAEQVSKFYTLLFSHPAVQALTWWDFSDRGAWQCAASGFLRKDMSPKPAYERLMQLVKKEWWTSHEARVDVQGSCELQAFHGTHSVTLQHAGRSAQADVVVSRNASNELVMKL